MLLYKSGLPKLLGRTCKMYVYVSVPLVHSSPFRQPPCSNMCAADYQPVCGNNGELYGKDLIMYGKNLIIENLAL